MNLIEPSIWMAKKLDSNVVEFLSQGFNGFYCGRKKYHSDSTCHFWQISNSSQKVIFEIIFFPTFKREGFHWNFCLEKAVAENNQRFSGFGFCSSSSKKLERFNYYNDEKGKDSQEIPFRYLYWLGFSFDTLSPHFSLTEHEKMELLLERNEALEKFGLT